MSSSRARWARPALGIIVTGVFLWLLSRQIDPAQLGAILARVPARSLLVAVICLAAGYAVRIVRWWWMLRALDPRVRLSACVWPFLVSIAVNT